MQKNLFFTLSIRFSLEIFENTSLKKVNLINNKDILTVKGFSKLKILRSTEEINLGKMKCDKDNQCKNRHMKIKMS